jgi:phosphatidylserine decarboxylase
VGGSPATAAGSSPPPAWSRSAGGSPSVSPSADRIALGERAARTLTAELARRRGPTNALLVGAEAGSAVLAAAVESLPPGGLLTVVPRQGAELRGWATEQIRIVESLADAGPADVAMVAEPVTGTAAQARALLGEVHRYLSEGGVLVAAAVAVPGLSDAAAELDRQDALFGVGADVVLRNNPPVRVHRLRYTPADPALAEQLAPAYRPSSVPVTRRMHIDSNGVAAAGIALGLAALARRGGRGRRGGRAQRGSKLWVVPALAALPVAAFFRDPERDVPTDEAAVVAASDGKVLSVERLRDRRFSDEDLLRIAVFLSVFDVHVNRAPVAGRVTDFFVTDGGFAAAMKPAAEHNVAAYTVLETPHGQAVVAQRTGLIARRIVQRAPVGALLAKGERFGLIRFGSRTDVYLPAARAQAVVAPGDRVAGGSSIIARWL